MVPANTFDNVQGEFPIGFFIWNTEAIEKFKQITADVYNFEGEFIGEKKLYGNLPESINKWIKIFDNKSVKGIGFMGNPSPDFQHNNQLYIYNLKGIEHFEKSIELNNSGTFSNLNLDANYFIGKAYLLIDEKAKAKDHLQDVVNSKGSYYKKAEELIEKL